MPLPDQTPKLSKLPFLLGDAVLLGAAWFVAQDGPHPLPAARTLAVLGCVALAGILGAVPFLADYARKQDEALDDRQRSLEALAGTAATAAEQIGIAAQGLHELVDLAHKNLKQAEELPQKFQRELAALKPPAPAKEDKKEERPIAALRAECDKLQAAGEKIARAAADLAGIEAALSRRLSEPPPAPPPEPTAERITKAAESLSPSVSRRKPKAEPAVEIPNAAGAAPSAPEPGSATPTPVEPPLPSPAPEPTTEMPPAPAAAATSHGAGEAIDPISDGGSQGSSSTAAEGGLTLSKTSGAGSTAAGHAEAGPESPAPAPGDGAGDASVASSPEPKPPKPRKPRPPRPAPEPKAEPTLDLDDSPPSSDGASEAADPASADALASDGATRLLVTAYIGIGNRLFIRGEGPGLSWERGVPLQFVSIGKWKWEADGGSSEPVRFKLYKNDEMECAALGQLELAPGHQQEVTARF